MLSLIAALLLLQTPPDPDEIEAMEETARETRAISEARAAEADALRAEIAELQAQLVEAGARVEARERDASEAQVRLAELEREEAELNTRLMEERESLAGVLAALQRLELNAPPALAVTPEDAAEAARAAGLLATIAPELERRARALRADIEALQDVREALTGQRQQVDTARAALASVRSEVEALITARQTAERALRREADDLSRQASRMAAEAQSFRQLWDEINRFANASPRLAPRRPAPIAVAATTSTATTTVETTTTLAEAAPVLPDTAERPTQELPGAATSDGSLLAALPADGAGGLRFADMRGRLRPPAEGVILTRAGRPGPDGITREGLWLETRPGGQVTAPFDGVVVFAGPFQSFEAVVMINTTDGYTLILGGIGLLYAGEGQSVLAGEPVGRMPEREIPAPRLYLEIRRGSGAAENPEDWLRPEFRRG